VVIIIKTFEELYNSLRDNFYRRTNIDIESRSVLDMIIKAVADALHVIHQTIEKNKKPYLFTTQTGEELDDTGFFLNCPRLDGESDDNYLYRLSNWTQRNASCNITAINNKCKELLYSSAANYVPYTHGLGTGTIYLIPLEYTDAAMITALSEAQEKVSTVIAPTSIVYFKIATPSYIRFTAYLDVKDGYDRETIKQNIFTTVKTYVNSIAPGEKLLLGDINKIGLNVTGVEYFNVIQLFNNGEELADFELLQTLISKFLLDEIIWWEVEN
jgi:uncharacterized phage protein gp47/JayE